MIWGFIWQDDINQPLHLALLLVSIPSVGLVHSAAFTSTQPPLTLHLHLITAAFSAPAEESQSWVL